MLQLFDSLFQSFYFKLRSMVPCCLSHLNFSVAVPEEELIQVRRLPTGIHFSFTENINIDFRSHQVAVTAVAMTFDKDQTQEKPAEKPIMKGENFP